VRRTLIAFCPRRDGSDVMLLSLLRVQTRVRAHVGDDGDDIRVRVFALWPSRFATPPRTTRLCTEPESHRDQQTEVCSV
jgi:hypothetical protein